MRHVKSAGCNNVKPGNSQINIQILELIAKTKWKICGSVSNPF